jgi:hypothetical protein
VAEALRAALPQQVDLQGGVDGDQVVVQSGQRGIVREVDRMNFQCRVAIHEAVELARAESEGRKHLSRQVVLAPVRDGAALHQRQDAVADHLGVDPEVVLVRELHHHGVGDTAVADLQRRTVFDHVGDVLADGHLHRADLRQSHFEHRLAAFDQRCNPRDVHMTVSVRKGTFGFTSSTTARARATAAMV